MENENEILKSLASGDQQVFSWLFRRYYLKSGLLLMDL